jgi:hypothetical protein
MAAGHIEPRVGNLLLIGLVGGIGALSILAIATYLKQHPNIPILSAIADSSLDIVKEAAA